MKDKGEKMLLSNAYLKNPVLPKKPKDKFYFVKCLEAEEFGGEIVAKLIIVPLAEYGESRFKVMYKTLRNTPKSQYMKDLFRTTFCVRGKIDDAIGRVGCVIIDDDVFNGRPYGTVSFHKQSPEAYNKARRIEKADQEGKIPWN